MEIYVGNLPVGTSTGHLRLMFGAYGTVEDVRAMTHRLTGRPVNFAFVKMPLMEEARVAICALDGNVLGGQHLKVDEARPVRRASTGDQDYT